jgi:hypothetical protein
MSLISKSARVLANHTTQPKNCDKHTLARRPWLASDFWSSSRGTLVKIPIALALWAATDENQQVRQWYARHVRLLDYSQLGLAECLENGLPELAQRFQFASDLKNNHEFSLLMVLLDDADPFVRACLRENPAFLDWVGADEAFRRSNYT